MIEICRRLDGIPLALELAAARVKVLAPEQILTRMTDRFRLLTGGDRAATARQQTLRATIEWSYDLLDEAERLLFERLSVFRGGCTLEAAEEICEADIDTLQSLIDKSLLHRERERFWMLETIREYAAEQFEHRGEADSAADRHADYFVSLAKEVYPHEEVEDPGRGRLLYHELDNLRRARTWLVDSGDVERELRLATAALWGLWTRASLRELEHWLVSALERDSGADPWLRAEALGGLALAAANLGERDDAREYARECLSLAREREDKRQIEWALRVLSFDEPDLDERRRLLQECERLNRQLGNRRPGKLHALALRSSHSELADRKEDQVLAGNPARKRSLVHVADGLGRAAGTRQGGGSPERDTPRGERRDPDEQPETRPTRPRGRTIIA